MSNLDVLNRFARLYEELFAHEGFGEIRVEMKILRKGQKEIILHCGKQYRFIVDATDRQPLRWGIWKIDENTMDKQSAPNGAQTGEVPAGGT